VFKYKYVCIYVCVMCANGVVMSGVMTLRSPAPVIRRGRPKTKTKEKKTRGGAEN
jgi:hypothetical protein